MLDDLLKSGWCLEICYDNGYHLTFFKDNEIIEYSVMGADDISEAIKDSVEDMVKSDNGTL